jgi:hypothetical protein
VKMVPARLGELREYRRPLHCGNCWRVGEPEPPSRYAIGTVDTFGAVAVMPTMTRQLSGIWQTTSNAQKRLRHGRTLRPRRDQVTSNINGRTGKRDYSIPRSSAALVTEFPALIMCPSCRHANVVEPSGISAVLT